MRCGALLCAGGVARRSNCGLDGGRATLSVGTRGVVVRGVTVRSFWIARPLFGVALTGGVEVRGATGVRVLPIARSLFGAVRGAVRGVVVTGARPLDAPVAFERVAGCEEVAAGRGEEMPRREHLRPHVLARIESALPRHVHVVVRAAAAEAHDARLEQRRLQAMPEQRDLLDQRHVGGGLEVVGVDVHVPQARHQPAAGDVDDLRVVDLGLGLVEDLGDAAFFELCERNGQKVLEGDRTAQEYAVTESVRAKARIVAEDERETTGARAMLNLGHTFGHALEAQTGFSDRLLHGEAVALGMVLAARYSARRGYISDDDADRVTAAIAAAGLPSEISALGLNCGGEALAAHMLHDKKMDAGTLPFVLLAAIGQAFLDKQVSLDDVAKFLDEELRAH